MGDELYSGLKIYPNPVLDVLRVEGIDSEAVISVYSLKGELMISDISSQISGLEIDMSDLAKGVYHVVISSEQAQITKRVIKQ